MKIYSRCFMRMERNTANAQRVFACVRWVADVVSIQLMASRRKTKKSTQTKRKYEENRRKEKNNLLEVKIFLKIMKKRRII